MSKTIPITIALAVILFASTAFADQVQIMNQGAQCLCSSSETAFYGWYADIQNCANCPVMARLKISFYDQSGQLINTVYRPIYLAPKHKGYFGGKACANCDASHIRDIRTDIVNIRSVGR